MKHFDKPDYEIVRFQGNVITQSVCGCWDGEDDWGAGANCSGDTPECTCGVNYVAGTANCIPCPSNS